MMVRTHNPLRKPKSVKLSVEGLEDRTLLSGLGLQSGDLVAGVQATNAYGELVSQIDLVRNGTVTPISAPQVGIHPVEVKADSSGRVVFLGVDYNFNNWGLYRVDTLCRSGTPRGVSWQRWRIARSDSFSRRVFCCPVWFAPGRIDDYNDCRQ